MPYHRERLYNQQSLTPEIANPQTAGPNNLKSVWEERVKKALHQAIAGGFATWLTGPGDPRRVLNPFAGFSQTGETYGPKNYRGVGAMGGRLRLAEDEQSAPMRAMRLAVERNPLLRGVRVKVAQKGELPEGAVGGITWREGYPEVMLVPRLSPHADPGATLTHELVGHGSHGHIRPTPGITREEYEKLILPRLEGFAEGATHRLYGRLTPLSAYYALYGHRPDFWESHAVGQMLANTIKGREQIPPQDLVLKNLLKFGEDY